MLAGSDDGASKRLTFRNGLLTMDFEPTRQSRFSAGRRQRSRACLAGSGSLDSRSRRTRHLQPFRRRRPPDRWGGDRLDREGADHPGSRARSAVRTLRSVPSSSPQRGRSLDSLLDEFARLRAANLDQLRSWQLTSADLDLTGIHPTFGRVTLRQLLSAWVVHDLGHVAQVARVMAKQYREAVGPWVRFLPVLTDHEVPRS